MSAETITAIAILSPLAWAVVTTIALLRLASRHRECKRTLNRVVHERDALIWKARSVEP